MIEKTVAMRSIKSWENKNYEGNIRAGKPFMATPDRARYLEMKGFAVRDVTATGAGSKPINPPKPGTGPAALTGAGLRDGEAGPASLSDRGRPLSKPISHKPKG